MTVVPQKVTRTFLRLACIVLLAAERGGQQHDASQPQKCAGYFLVHNRHSRSEM